MCYDDYWDEPNEFEMQIEEFKTSLRNAVRTEIKEKIESLEKELAELKTFRDERDKFIRECDNKIAEARRETKEIKAMEEKWKKARLHQLLGDYLTVGWKAESSYEYGKKCEKCDEDRKIHFTSPQGNKYKEDCKCAKKHYKYFPKEVPLVKFYVRKENFHSDNEGVDFRNRYYIAKDDYDFDCYSSASDVYASSEIDYETVNTYRGVFLHEEDCQKYCDWANEKELKKKQQETCV